MKNNNKLLEKKEITNGEDIKKNNSSNNLIKQNKKNVETSKKENNNKDIENSESKEKNSNTVDNKTPSELAIQKIPDRQIHEFKPLEKTTHDVKAVITFVLSIFVAIILILILGFTFYNAFNTNIINGVHIKGIDVSNMSKADAKYQVDTYIEQNLPEEIKLKYNDFETTVSLSQIDVSFDTRAASNSAYTVGRQGNFLENNFYVFSTLFSNVNIEPVLKMDKAQLSKNLEEMSSQLPDSVVQSSYYVEDNNLIVTSGKSGNVVDVEKTIETISNSIQTLSCKDNPIDISVKTQEPDKIDIQKIHDEIYKEPVDAYYTKEPFSVYPSENGLDFNISIEEANAIINSEQKDEYAIPVKVLYPNITTNMIGTEAFPDLLSTFSTNYAASNRNRTTNLILAANKINGTVIMPGETFSYNKVVGERTIAAGYREAPIYVKGEVVDGLGGGICQITSTLYNAAVYANLEITQRTNHQFVPSYVSASRDATVVYGALDF
ncbi:MAG: VanW family protein, partial [Clostridia bacterium]|nr:VanW family protein [Clostridia bacterium]